MKKIKPWALFAIPFLACQIAGCGKPQPVDVAITKKTASFSPAHKALVEQRRKQDGD
jgi:hypothetical protein